MTKGETPYLTYGLGYEEDERLTGKDPYCEDVLDLADYLIKKYPKERWSIMHKMFSIGFHCGERAEAGKGLGDDELHQHATKLSSIADQIKLIERLLESAEYSRVSGDEFALHFQIHSGVLSNMNDVLSTLKEDIQNISNVICPD
jgi:hypothetical protein